MSTGVATLYGRFDTMIQRSPSASSSPQSTVSASASMISTGWPATTFANTPASRLSSSTARTDAPAAHNASVSEPSPGPTSTTRSPGCTPARRTMCAAMFESARKF
jgi:hypothetical protein